MVECMHGRRGRCRDCERMIEAEAERDRRAAREALADFEENGGTTLEDLKRELGLK